MRVQMRGHVTGRMRGQVRVHVRGHGERPCEEANGVRGGRPHESEVGGHVRPKWEAA